MAGLLAGLVLFIQPAILAPPATAQTVDEAGDAEASAGPLRGSIVEDRAARKLIEAGEARYDAEEITKAIEIWQSVIERYPRSRVRFTAHMRLGDYFLERDRAYDQARTHFEAGASEENGDEQLRAEATLKMGICFYHARNYGKCFEVMRDVIEQFPVSPQVNQAYYYIGLGHFQLGHYSRAISALEKVGTALAGEDRSAEKLEAGKRFFVKIEDADLAVLDPGQPIAVRCETTSGDSEQFQCFPVGRNVRLVLGSLPTQLGRPTPDNGILEVTGNDQVYVTYVDAHTADKELDREVRREVQVVGDAVVAVTDGAYEETLNGVVLGKAVNLRIADADRDVSDEADSLTAAVEVYRQKTDEEMEAELADLISKQSESEEPLDIDALTGGDEPQISRFKVIDRVEVAFTETVAADPQADSTLSSTSLDATQTDSQSESESDAESASGQTTDENNATVHSGVFHATVSLIKSDEIIEGDETLQARPGDQIRVTYLDEKHSRDGVRQVVARASCLEGNIGGVRVTRAEITDQELRIETQLKTASALTNIGNRYKEFGLKKKADDKYQQALGVCEDTLTEAQRLGGRFLEQTYVQLWQVYFQMDRLELAAAMCQRLQREFPNSGFVDDALLQLADVAKTSGDLRRAIGIYIRLVNMDTSQLRGEAQFGIAACYEEMAGASQGAGATQLHDRAFQEYKKVFDHFPDSGRVGEAVAKMAQYFYDQKDYSRAIDTFETVLENHPDAKFLDVILFNYGRCLYRMERKADARRRFEQLIGEFPESPLATDAKRISEALANSGF